MKRYILILLAVFFMAIYLLVINLISGFITENNFNSANFSNSESNRDYIKLSMSDNVDVQVVRNRWYGEINEKDGKKDMRLFNLIKIPLNNGGFNFVWIHIIALIISFVIMIL